MQGSQSSDGQPSTFFSTALHQASSLFTPKRVSYTLAGAFVFAGAAAVIGSSAAEQPSPQVKGNQVQLSDTSSQIDDPAVSQTDSGSSSTSVSAHSSVSGGSSDMHVTVNGQDMPVPTNGSTQQTITNPDGSTTTTSTSSSATSQGSASNSSHSSFSLNVHSTSTSEGGVTSQ